MIISHKYKYIFLKPTKVAGTSIEVALAKHCGRQDIITPILDFSQDSDEDDFVQPARNHQGFLNHFPPNKIIDRIGKKIWNEYYKFTVVRNPWDQVVSRYFWEKKTKTPTGELITPRRVISNLFNPEAYKYIYKLFFAKKSEENPLEEFLDYFLTNWTNTRFYFDKEGKPICDFYIKFENLDGDYKKVCENIGIPYEPLPRVKTKFRGKKAHYSTYYNRRAKSMVEKIFEKEIRFFKYQFEEINEDLSVSTS